MSLAAYGTFSITRLLSGENMPKQRYQTIQSLRQSKNGSWFIRPWVDIVTSTGIQRKKRIIVLGPGSIGKREAVRLANEAMRKINHSDFVVRSQIPFTELIDEFKRRHIESDRIAASTAEKYRVHIKNHILPAFQGLTLSEITAPRIEDWLETKEKLSWSTRTDLRNLLSAIFTRAEHWGYWKERNPVESVSTGRKRLVREKRKLTDEQTRRFLAALPYDLRLMCCTGLFCTLRVSEMLGLQEKHLDCERGRILVRQRYYRGDIDVPKSPRALRDVPMGYLNEDLKRLVTGDPERFVFEIKTRPKWGQEESTSRDDRDLNHNFLRPAAKNLGFYWKGFGFHSLRREAITSIGSVIGIGEAMHAAGHSTVDQSLDYMLDDMPERDRAIRQHQERILGKTGGLLN